VAKHSAGWKGIVIELITHFDFGVRIAQQAPKIRSNKEGKKGGKELHARKPCIRKTMV